MAKPDPLLSEIHGDPEAQTRIVGKDFECDSNGLFGFLDLQIPDPGNDSQGNPHRSRDSADSDHHLSCGHAFRRIGSMARCAPRVAQGGGHPFTDRREDDPLADSDQKQPAHACSDRQVPHRSKGLRPLIQFRNSGIRLPCPKAGLRPGTGRRCILRNRIQGADHQRCRTGRSDLEPEGLPTENLETAGVLEPGADLVAFSRVGDALLGGIGAEARAGPGGDQEAADHPPASSPAQDSSHSRA